jgi:hypothetical protein
MRGPDFSRVFNNPGGLYSERFKHVIGPEVVWSYRTRVDDFHNIPRFDRIDYYLGTHQVRYGLVNRFLAKRQGRGGQLTTHEFLNWRVFQTYYVQIADNQNSYDPNYSSSAFGPGGEPSHYSPIQSRLKLSPTREFNVDFRAEYDVNFHQLRSVSLVSRLRASRADLSASWTRANRLSEIPEEREVRRDFLRGSIGLNLLPGRLRLDASGDYDILNQELIHARARLRYDVQCCGFSIETIQYNYNGRDEREFRFSIELANIGSVGNFMGEEAEQAARRRR